MKLRALVPIPLLLAMVAGSGSPLKKSETKARTSDLRSPKSGWNPRLTGKIVDDEQAKSTTKVRVLRSTKTARALQSSRRRTEHVRGDGLSLFGKIFARLAPIPQSVAPFLKGGVELFFYRAPPPTSLWTKEVAYDAYRPERTRQFPLQIKGAYRRLRILRPGLGNHGPSPAAIFRWAENSGRVIIAYTNTDDPEKNALRPVGDTLHGVPVPEHLREKILVIGSEEPNFISWRQSSDTFLEQLGWIQQDEAARRANGEEGLLGFDLKTAHAQVIGHSQGGWDAAWTHLRLTQRKQEGLGDIISEVMTLGTPFNGSEDMRFWDPGFWETVAFKTAAASVAGKQARVAVEELTGDYLEKEIYAKVGRDAIKSMVNLAVGGSIFTRYNGADGEYTFNNHNYSRNYLYWAKVLLQKAYATREGKNRKFSDGMVTLASALMDEQERPPQDYGKYDGRFFPVVLPTDYDHARLWEDPDVVDVVLRIQARDPSVHDFIRQIRDRAARN